jgi:hypothetical protein
MKSKLKIVLEFGVLLVLWKTFDNSDLIEFISQFLDLRCGRLFFLVDFVVKNSNKLQKLGLEGKIGWAFNVFIVGPTAHATLIIINKNCKI